MEWAGGRVTEATVYSARGGSATVAYNGKRVRLSLKPGQSATLR